MCLRTICCRYANICTPISAVMFVCHSIWDISTVDTVCYIFSMLDINMIIMQAGEMTRMAKMTSETITDRCVELWPN